MGRRKTFEPAIAPKVERHPLEREPGCACPPLWPLEYGSGKHHPGCPERIRAKEVKRG